MIRFPKSPALPVLLACALLQLPAAARVAPADNSALFSDPVVATGKGFEIKRSQVDDAFINYNASVVANGQTIPELQRAIVRSNLLQGLIVNKILFQKATDDDKATAGKQVDDYLLKVRTNAASPEAFDLKVKATGLTLAQLRDRMVEDQLCRSIRTREITNGIVVSDDEVKKFYQDYPDKFKVPERVRVAHILISTIDPATKQTVPPEKKKEKFKLAQDLKARAEKGEDFAALVKEYSEDPGSKSKGGEYTFRRGQMVIEFEDAAFSMKVGQISDPVETQYGYHVIKLLEKLPANTVEFDKAAPDIRSYLIEQAAEKKLPAYLEQLKASADVKIVSQEGDKPEADKGSPAAK
jgi:parvulin-like peptidyl-prolyl isomerase